MRKHFLILMLLTLLPFAGWAVPQEPEYPVDLSDGWVITLTPVSAAYNGATQTPTVTLTKGDYSIPSTKFIVTWSNDEREDVSETGYTVTVTSDMINTVDALATPTKKFWILKNSVSKSVDPAVADDTDEDDTNGVQVPYDEGNPIALLKTAPKYVLKNTAVDVTTKGGVIEYYVNGVKWTGEGTPTAANTGEYTVSYKVIGTSNFDGTGDNAIGIGTVNIVGTDINPTAVTAPEAVEGLKFEWNDANEAAVSHALVSEGSIDETLGTMMYRLGTAGEWKTTVPTASAAADDYKVYWKVAPVEGKNEYFPLNDDPEDGPLNPIVVEIAPSTPVISFADGEVDLTYDPEATPQLLSGAATATIGASDAIKYKFRFNADAEHVWAEDVTTEYSDAITNVANVKAQKAGSYQIQAYIEDGGNYKNAVAVTTTSIIKTARAFTAVPQKVANLIWKGNDLTNANEAQQLLTAGENTVAGKVKYKIDGIEEKFDEVDWTTDITKIKAAKALTYTVRYKVDAENYTAEQGSYEVTIGKKVLSVKVNDITKTYDATTTLTDAVLYEDADEAAAAGKQVGDVKTPANYTLDGTATHKFTFITPLDGYTTGLTDALPYAAITNSEANNKHGEHADLVTVAEETLEAINTTNGYYYEFTVIPGKLTVEKAPLTVKANTGLTTTYGTALDIENEYTIEGLATGEDKTDAFGINIPKLVSPQAEAAQYNVDTYAVEFTKGILRADGNYVMSTEGEAGDGYVIGTADLKITANESSKIVITIIPHTQPYTGVAESWDNITINKDYYVSGLIGTDQLHGLKFKRSDAGKFDVDTYALEIDDTELTVDHPERYPLGFVLNNSTFEITPVELTATVNQQTVVQNGDALPNAKAWSVTGIVDAEKDLDIYELLGGTLAINETEGDDPANLTTIDDYENGILLTITNANYTLKAGTEWGTLRVISASTLELNQEDQDLATKIATAAAAAPGADGVLGGENAADDVTFNVTFAPRTLEADMWYTMVLPFNTTPKDVVTAFKEYVVINRMSDASTKDKISFVLEMNEIPAGEPFLVKVANEVKLGVNNVGDFDGQIIVADAKTINGQGDTQFIGTYTTKSFTNKDTEESYKYGYLNYSNIGEDINDELKWENKWYTSSTRKFTVKPLEAYLIYEKNYTSGRGFDFDEDPLITVQEADGSTTAISQVNAGEFKAVATDGWYTINGVKLQSMPTEKGIYINNGKKVVIK